MGGGGSNNPISGPLGKWGGVNEQDSSSNGWGGAGGGWKAETFQMKTDGGGVIKISPSGEHVDVHPVPQPDKEMNISGR